MTFMNFLQKKNIKTKLDICRLQIFIALCQAAAFYYLILPFTGPQDCSIYSHFLCDTQNNETQCGLTKTKN